MTSKHSNDQNSKTGGKEPAFSQEQELKTEREIERNEEDQDFVPVIVKRTDEALRHPDDILEKEVAPFV